MPTPKQLARRDGRIGATDSAAILGVDPWRSSWDVWARVTGRVSDRAQARDLREASEIGKVLEPVILDWAAERLGVKIRKNQQRVHPRYRFLIASHDSLVVGRGPRVGVEAKTSGIVNPGSPFLGEWGREETDEVPDHYVVQAAHQMMVSRLDRVWIGALLAGRGRCLFKIERDEDLIGSMLDRVMTFWRDHVKTDVPPADSAPAHATLTALTRVPKATTEIDSGTVEEWLKADAKAKSWAEVADARQRLLLAALGEAEIGTSKAGRISYFEESREGVDYKALRKLMPATAEEYTRRTYFRRFRFRKPETRATIQKKEGSNDGKGN